MIFDTVRYIVLRFGISYYGSIYRFPVAIHGYDDGKIDDF